MGLAAAEHYLKTNKNEVVITLGTAHPIKFSDAVKKALGFSPELPNNFKEIYELEEKYTVLENSAKEVRNFILGKY